MLFGSASRQLRRSRSSSVQIMNSSRVKQVFESESKINVNDLLSSQPAAAYNSQLKTTDNIHERSANNNFRETIVAHRGIVSTENVISGRSNVIIASHRVSNETKTIES